MTHRTPPGITIDLGNNLVQENTRKPPPKLRRRGIKGKKCRQGPDRCDGDLTVQVILFPLAKILHECVNSQVETYLEAVSGFLHLTLTYSNLDARPLITSNTRRVAGIIVPQSVIFLAALEMSAKKTAKLSPLPLAYWDLSAQAPQKRPFLSALKRAS